MCLIHWTARVGLRAAGEGADDLHDEELEAGPLRRRVPPGDHWVGVEKIVCHPRIHATVDEARDAEHAAAARVERARLAVDAESVGHVLTTGQPMSTQRVRGVRVTARARCSLCRPKA